MMKTIKPLFTLFLTLPLLCGAADFVKVKGAHFIRDNKPYYFIGANFWQGMNLGSKRSYADEPAIMSWQLANEPRGSYNSAAFNEGYQSAKTGSPLAGVAFWAWAGENRPPRPGAPWKPGDPWLGDPPHEFQGWYSVYDCDTTTVNVKTSSPQNSTRSHYLENSPCSLDFAKAM